MANKTKNELLMEIEELRKTLDDKENELIKYEEIAMCTNMGEEYKLIYDNYVKAGFTEGQAFKLLQITVERTINDFIRSTTQQRRFTSYRPYRSY